MRLLPVRANHERRHPAERKFQANRQRHRRSHVRQHLPLRNLPAHPPRYSPRRRNGRGKEVVMSRFEEHIETTPELSAAEHSNVTSAKSSRIARRDFLKTTATIGGGLWISAYVPELAAHPDSKAPASATVFAPTPSFESRPTTLSPSSPITPKWARASTPACPCSSMKSSKRTGPKSKSKPLLSTPCTTTRCTVFK